MKTLLTIKLPARLENFPVLMQSVAGCARDQDLAPEKISRLELATEEALANIFTYAYQDTTGDVEITCMRDAGEKFMVEIVDSGVPFNMLEKEAPDITADISERPIGGLGIYFIRQFMDDIHYRREGEKNILRLIVVTGKNPQVQ